MEMSMNKKTIFGVVGVVVAVIAIAVLFRFMGKVTLYSDEHTRGNTSSNLLNGGLFCQIDDTIYFSNPYKNGMLYSMNTDLGDVKEVNSDNVSYLNGAGKYLFYTKRNDKKEVDSDSFMQLSATGLYRYNIKRHNLGNLYEDPTQVACLYGNNVYYQHYDQKKGLLLYAASIDGSEDKKLKDEACAPFAIDNDSIYYTGMASDHNIHVMNISGTNDRVLYEGNCTALTKQGDYLYFLDMAEDYALKRISVDGGSAETLVSNRLATYNVSEDGTTIYCQIDNQTDNGLYVLDVDSLSLDLIKSGNYNYLHLVSDYLFFEEYDQSIAYAMDLTSGDIVELNEARDVD